MRTLNSLVIRCSALLVAGCGAKSGSSATPATNSVNQATNGFGGYVKSLGESQKSADKTIDVSYINQAMQLFNVQEGRYPKDLQELVPNYVAKLPDLPPGFKLTYDSTAGTAKIVQQ